MEGYAVLAHTDSGVVYMGYDYSAHGRRFTHWFADAEDAACFTNEESAQIALDECIAKGNMPHGFRDQDIQKI